MERHDHLRIKLERGSVSSATPAMLSLVVWGLLGLIALFSIVFYAAADTDIEATLPAVPLWLNLTITATVIASALCTVLAGVWHRTAVIMVLMLALLVIAESLSAMAIRHVAGDPVTRTMGPYGAWMGYGILVAVAARSYLQPDARHAARRQPTP